ncbi:MAG: ABC transporter substrate-binding protein [Bacteroidales bacterium]|nr:ABC transporter substrate-binding protein [Bacteroidales bacterium]
MIILCLTAVISCNEKRGVRNAENTSGTNIISIAQRIAIERYSGYTKVTIKNPWQGADNINMVYYLVKRGSELPPEIDSSSVIRVPVGKIVCMSTTHIAMISALGEGKSIAGMSGTGFMYSPELRSMADAGLIKDVGYEANLNKELILKIMPDLTMIYGVGSESSGYVGKIEELGIKVVYNADYLETDPLGKAEWIKLFGALYCREQMADSIFSKEVDEYNKLKSFVAERSSVNPIVLLGLPFKDTWFISPGNSFVSKLIADAGGEYLWKDTKSSVSMPLGLENVYLKAVNADYWLNIGTVKTISEIPAIDPRLTDLPCYKSGKLYNNNNRITEAGGNDFWESGAVYPHLILQDIASILHPEIFPDNNLTFYRKVN